MVTPFRSEDDPYRPRHFKPLATAVAPFDDEVQHSLETARTRLLLTAGIFVLAFMAIASRLVWVTLIRGGGEERLARERSIGEFTPKRADILDRNGVVIATMLASPSLYADPKKIANPQEAARKLVSVLPDLSEGEVLAKLSSDRSFVWLKRHLTPRQEFEVNRLGIPAFQFEREERRVYPEGNLVAHVIGYSGMDDKGLAGIERGLDDMLRESKAPLILSIDLRLQHILHEELSRAVADFTAKAGVGMILDLRNGEILAMISLPDFDPNKPGSATPDMLFNRATLGVYEMGSTFKIFTMAMALDAHTTSLTGGYDAAHPIHIGRFTISDYHAQNRWLSVPEIFEYSSNIGAARMALDAGTERQRDFLGRLGLLRAPTIEVPEIGSPQIPNPWHEVNTLTVAFGHGISVSPLQLAVAAGAVMDGGILRQATLLKRPEGYVSSGQQVMSARTSEDMRRLLRLVVEHGTGTMAAAPGYLVGGKTGTAEKAGIHGYAHKALLSSFIGGFPINDPRYLVMAIIDEPQPNAKSHGFATAGWTAAPVVGRTVQRIAPLLGIQPQDEKAPEFVRAFEINAPSMTASGMSGSRLAAAGGKGAGGRHAAD